MEPTPQRATIVLEHASATMDFDDEDYNDGHSWSVVAYLVFDSGSGRDRAGHTLDGRHAHRAAPAAAPARLQKAALDGDVGDVGAPDLIGPVDGHLRGAAGHRMSNGLPPR